MSESLSSWLFPQTVHANQAWLGQQLAVEPKVVQSLMVSRVAMDQSNALVRKYCGYPTLPTQPLAKTYCALSDQQRCNLAKVIWHGLFLSLRFRIIDGAMLRNIHQQVTNNLFDETLTTPNHLNDLPDELHQEFLARCHQSHFTDWLRALGVRVLEMIMEDSSEFATRRLSIAFEPQLWALRPTNIVFNRNQLRSISEYSLTQLDKA